MLLGKRPRPPMKRTTSMTEFTPDLGVMEAVDATQPSDQERVSYQQPRQRAAGFDWLDQRSYVATAGMLSPRNNNRRSSGDFMAVETAPFLRACGLCKRRLGPGRDIFMYRGEVAFCSLECRQQQMNQDERKEKCSVASIKTETPPTTTGSEASSGSGETMAAA